MLLFEGSSETGLFRRLSNHIFAVGNIGNAKAMKVIFFLKTLKILTKFQKFSKKIAKNFLVSQIIASELVSLNCLY